MNGTSRPKIALILAFSAAACATAPASERPASETPRLLVATPSATPPMTPTPTTAVGGAEFREFDSHLCRC